ncbi:hypothetical protein, partial [Streptomyces scabiei]
MRGRVCVRVGRRRVVRAAGGRTARWVALGTAPERRLVTHRGRAGSGEPSSRGGRAVIARDEPPPH